jgi:hypothetical protein
MKSTILGIAVVLFLIAGCSKTSNSTGQSAFVGNYHMYDTFSYSNNTVYGTHYDLQIIALSGTSDRAVFNNIGGGGSDTATISGNLATFTNGLSYATSATISGNTITMTLTTYNVPVKYSNSMGTKF